MTKFFFVQKTLYHLELKLKSQNKAKLIELWAHQIYPKYIHSHETIKRNLANERAIIPTQE